MSFEFLILSFELRMEGLRLTPQKKSVAPARGLSIFVSWFPGAHAQAKYLSRLRRSAANNPDSRRNPSDVLFEPRSRRRNPERTAAYAAGEICRPRQGLIYFCLLVPWGSRRRISLPSRAKPDGLSRGICGETS